MPILATIALVTAFNILIHLGFASATSLASALIPVFIALSDNDYARCRSNRIRPITTIRY